MQKVRPHCGQVIGLFLVVKTTDSKGKYLSKHVKRLNRNFFPQILQWKDFWGPNGTEKALKISQSMRNIIIDAQKHILDSINHI